MFCHYKIILLVCFLYSLPACQFGLGYNSENLSLFHSLPSVGELAYSDSEYFYLDLDIERYITANDVVPYYEISTTENFGDSVDRDSPSNCEIPALLPEDPDDLTKTASEESLICILDVLEYDILVKDLHIIYNFPHGMCDYVEVSLPWHFNFPIEKLKKTTTCERPSEEGGETKQCNRNDCENRNPDPNSDTYVACVDGANRMYCNWDTHCKNEVEDTDTEADFFTCEKPGTTEGVCLEKDSPCGPDDCEPLEKKEELECPRTGPPYLLPDDPPRCCAGENSAGDKEDPPAGCYGGPALIASGDYASSVQNLSDAQIRRIPEGGLRDTITLSSIIGVNNGMRYNNVGISSLIANYIEDLDVSPGTEVDRSDLPNFLQRDEDSPSPEPRLFFDFECFDQAGESLHLIQLMIREWNTLEEFIDFYEDGGNDDADPDVVGDEGEDCEYESFTRLASGKAPCNDLMDFADIESCESAEACLVACNNTKTTCDAGCSSNPATQTNCLNTCGTDQTTCNGNCLSNIPRLCGQMYDGYPRAPYN